MEHPSGQPWIWDILQLILDIEHPSGQAGCGTSSSSSSTWGILQVSLDVGPPLLDQDKLAVLSLLEETFPVGG